MIISSVDSRNKDLSCYKMRIQVFDIINVCMIFYLKNCRLFKLEDSRATMSSCVE